MEQTQTLLEQTNLGQSSDALTDPSQGGDQSASISILTPIKSWSSLFKPLKSSQQACTYWGGLSEIQKLDAIGSESKVLNSIGSRKAWHPKGDLLQRWDDELYPQIMGILNADLSRKFIYKNLTKQPGFVCDLWMVGPGAARETAYPTIVAICENPAVAKKTLYVLKRNPQLRGLELGFEFMPCKETIALTAGEVGRLVDNRSSETEGSQLCGSRIVASSIPISVSSQWVQATIGGVLLLNGIYYGLSVAHAFYPEEVDTTGRSTTGGVSNDVQQDEESSDDEKDWDGIFDALCVSEAVDNNEDISEPSTPAREPCATVVYLPSDRKKLEAHELGSIPPTGNEARDFLENLALVGHIPQPKVSETDMSGRKARNGVSQWTSCTMDWALIRLHDPRFWGRNFFKSISGGAILTSFVAESPPYGKVMIATRENGPRITQSWGRKCGLSLPGVKRMQEVWCLELSCTKGECGAWVIDPETGCLYGIVVATSEGLDVTYILPAHSLLADINERFGGEPGRLENMFPKGEMKAWSPDIDEDVIGELGGLEDMSQQDEIESRSSDMEEDAMRQRFQILRDQRKMTMPKPLYGPWEVSQTSNGRRGRYITQDGVRYFQWEGESTFRRVDPPPTERSQPRHIPPPAVPRRIKAPASHREERRQTSGAAHTVVPGSRRSNQELASTNPQDSTRVQSSPAAPFTLFPRDNVPRPVNLATSAPTQDTYPLTSRSGSNDRTDPGRPKPYLRQQGGDKIETTVAKGSVSSQRPSESPRAGYATLNRAGTTYLSRLSSEFTQLQYGDYASCEVFIAKNPAILEVDPNTLVQEAFRLQKEGRHAQAKVSVQQSIILRQCLKTSREGRQAFFSGLKRRDQSIFGAFLDNLDKVMDAVRRSAPPETQSNNALPGQARRDTIDNSLSSGMQTMNLGSQNRQDQINPVRTGSEGQNAPAQYSRSRTGLFPRRSFLIPVKDDDAVGMERAPSIEPDIRGTERDSNNTDPKYIQRFDARKFFVVGRVFALICAENAGAPRSDLEGYMNQTTEGRFGTRIYSHPLRMAVVKERHGYCVCVPIQTYGGQGVMKSGLDQAERRAHAIIHASDTNPSATSEEQKILVKKPIAVNMASKEQKLDKFSRVNFAKPYTVEWNVKAMNVGRVAPTSMTVFESYYRMETNG